MILPSLVASAGRTCRMNLGGRFLCGRPERSTRRSEKSNRGRLALLPDTGGQKTYPSTQDQNRRLRLHPHEVHQVNSAYQEVIKEILGSFRSTRKTRYSLIPDQTSKSPLCYPFCFSRIAVRASSPQQHSKPSQYSPTSLRN